jgi:hypothetical protein
MTKKFQGSKPKIVQQNRIFWGVEQEKERPDGKKKAV